jgi:imidazolonepropionase-like amidohydrolase
VIRFLLFIAVLVLSACGDLPSSDTKVILGATLVHPTKPPTPYGVVVVKDGVITAVGAQQMIPIPPGSSKTEAYGKYVMHANGDLQIGAKADLVILAGDPKTNPKVERRMTGGRWVE